MTPEYIVIHHSATKDGSQNDWEAIRRYHMSWRYQGNIITEAEAKARIANGVKGVESPWKDIGYNWGAEFDGDCYRWKIGRPLTMNGAHCLEQGMNHRSIGICVVGNYDLDLVPDRLLQIVVQNVAALMQQFKIPRANIKRHSDYASYKTCPGTRFPWYRFIAELP